MDERRSRLLPPRDDGQFSSYYWRMLSEDTYRQAVPYRSGPDAYVLTVEGAQAYDVERALSLSHHESGMDNFVRHIASGLLSQPEVWLEVWFTDSVEPENKFGVCEVQGVKRKPNGGLAQVLPPASELPDWIVIDERWENEIDLDAARMIRIRTPEAYPADTLRGIMQEVSGMRIAHLPDWVTAQMDGQRTSAPRFDVAEASRTERLRVAQITSPIGWTAREWIFGSGDSRTMSEYYRRWRELQFLHFVASLRERAEDALRQTLTLAGDRCGFVASVVSNDVCTPDEVSEITRLFEDGDLPFEVVDDIILQQAGAADIGRRQVV